MHRYRLAFRRGFRYLSSVKDAKFFRFTEADNRDERNRIQLAAFLNTLYTKQIESLHASPQTSSSSSVSTSLLSPDSDTHHVKKFSDPLDSSNFEKYLDLCLSGTHIVDEEILHHRFSSADSHLSV